LQVALAASSLREAVDDVAAKTGLPRRTGYQRAVGLAGKERRKPPPMSGGERQRVAIARALANEPALVLADEPTSGLDDDSTRQVLDLLDRLRADDAVTVLAVSHDARLIDRADRVIRLVSGSIAAS